MCRCVLAVVVERVGEPRSRVVVTAVAATTPRTNDVKAAAPRTRFSEVLGLGAVVRRPSSAAGIVS